MASIRCEEVVFDKTTNPNGLFDSSGNTALSKIGTGNTWASPSVSAEILPAVSDRERVVLVRAFGGDYIVTMGVNSVATDANSYLLRAEEYVQFKLPSGQSIAAKTTTVA